MRISGRITAEFRLSCPIYDVVCEQTRVDPKYFQALLGEGVSVEQECTLSTGLGLTRRAVGVDLGDRRCRSRVVGAVEIRGGFEPGTGPYLPQCATEI